MNNRQSKMLQILKEEEGFISGRQLSIKLGVSDRTVRSDINFLNNDYLLDSYIKSNNRLGYKITGIMKSFQKKDYFDYNSRSFFIIQYLMESESWFTYQKISQKIDVSPQTISADVAKIFDFIKNSYFNIILETKPFKGIRLLGNEIDKRLLLASYTNKYHSTKEELYHELGSLFLNWFTKNAIEQMVQTLNKCVKEHNIFLNINTLSELAVNVLIQKYRSSSFTIPHSEIDFEFDFHHSIEFDLANSIVQNLLNQKKEMKSEIYYLTFFLIGLKISHYKEKKEIDETFYTNIEQAISFTSKKYGYNLLGDRKFKENLTEHLKKTIYPMKHRIGVKNPFLEDIKLQYIQAYQMAIVFSEHLSRNLGLHIPENEIGYIALHIEASIERKNDLFIKMAILSSNSDIIITLIKQKIEKNFPQVKVEGIFSLNTIKNIPDDTTVVISTIPVEILGKKTIIVNSFLQSSDITHIRNNITFGTLKEYIKKENFIYLNETSKTSFLKQMTKKLGLQKYLKGILDRESLASTDIGRKIALPHPLFSVEEPSSAVYVGVNKNDINWGDSKVNLVFLIILSEKDKMQYEYIYREVYQLIRYESKAIRLSQVESYDSFKKFL